VKSTVVESSDACGFIMQHKKNYSYENDGAVQSELRFDVEIRGLVS
jgi:hypothetical protein